MSFLRMRRHARKPVTLALPEQPVREILVPVEVNGRKFASVRALREYEQRKDLADKATRFYLENRAMGVIDGREHKVKFGQKRNAKVRDAVSVTSRHQPALPDNVPEGFEHRAYEHSGDVVRPVPSTTMNDRRWMGGTGKRQGNPFWSGDVDRKLRKAVK